MAAEMGRELGPHQPERDPAAVRAWERGGGGGGRNPRFGGKTAAAQMGTQAARGGRLRTGGGSRWRESRRGEMGKEAAAARIPSSGGGNGDVGEGTRELKCPSRQPLRPNAGNRRFGARIARFAVPRRETAGALNFFCRPAENAVPGRAAFSAQNRKTAVILQFRGKCGVC